MKKAMKKLMAALLAVAMVCAMAIPAFAAVDITSHTFEAYQIFAGDLNEGTLSNVTWGHNVTTATLLNYLKTANAAYSACTDAKGVAEVLSNNPSLKYDFAKIAADHVTGTAMATGTGSVTLPSAGYYLIVDTTDVANKHDAKNLSLLQVSGATTVTPQVKTDIPTLQKKVKDKNDSIGDCYYWWQDSADYDIGDTIPYQLTATLGNVSNFDTYYVEFVDTMDHLTYNSITSVKVDDTTLTAGQYQPTWDAAKKELTVSIDDVKQYGATTGSQIVVEYTATLDSDAVIGSTGNPNTAYLIFSNNPNGTGTGKTAPDKNIVFTYKVVANKIDENDKPLPGAAFALYKKLPTVPTNGTSYILQDNEPYALIKELNVGVGGKVENETRTNFEWDGIDDGDYMIKEIITPAGYNSIEPITFTVTADHEIEADNPKLIELKGGDKFTGSVDNCSLTISIENRMGSTLPGTGGIGTTIFYVVGGGLMVAAAILLITKKRMENH